MTEPCKPVHAGNNDLFNLFRIPNCDDPIFRMWCDMCNLQGGELVDERDVRLLKLERYMHGWEDYDPESDPDDDYLTPDGF